MTNNNYRTSDYWIAATLMALGEKFIDVDRSNGPRADFIFVRSSSIEMKVEEYKRGELLLEPQNLFVQTKLLKNRLYDRQ